MQVEMHCHTKESSPCGHVSARELVNMYKAKGYGMVVITDHYAAYQWDAPRLMRKSWDKRIEFYLRGYRAAKSEGDAIGMKVALGLEVQFDGYAPYDFLVYGVDEEFVMRNPYLNAYSPYEFRELCDEHGFAMFQAHPYRFDKAPLEPMCCHGIEVVNGNPRHNSHNALAVEYAREHSLNIISGSDFHEKEDCAIGGVMLDDDISTSKDVAASIIARSPELIVTYEEDRK